MNKLSATLLACVVWLGLISPLQGAEYAEEYGWSFKNFKDASISWDVYRDTFIGIPPESAAASPFDALFYEEVCKSKLPEVGACYGMSLLSLMMIKNGGHYGFCLPISQYSGDPFKTATVNGDSTGAGPSDPLLRRAIRVLHGHQVNLPTLELIMDLLARNVNRDASFAYQSFKESELRQDPALVSITKSLAPGSKGHTMVAYRAEDNGGGNRRIYVYDSNRNWGDPSSRAFYTSGNNYINISGNSWSFDKGSEIWSGDPASGGNLIIIPISVTGPHSRSPASLGLGVIGKILNTIFISGQSAEIEQISDGNGRHLFKPGTQQMDTDPLTGLLNVVPCYPSGQERPDDSPSISTFVQLGRADATLQVRVTAGTSGYTLRALGPQGHVTVVAHGGRGTDIITLREIGGVEPQLQLENRRGGDAYDVQFTHAPRGTRPLRVITSSDLRLPEGAKVELAASQQADALSVRSSSSKVEYNLELRTIAGKEIRTLQKRRVMQSAGSLRSIRPVDWNNLSPSSVLERVESVPERKP